MSAPVGTNPSNLETQLRSFRFTLHALFVAAASSSVPALAQESTIIIPRPVELDYDRGRNESVTQRPRPDYEPLGVRSGGIVIYPRIETGAGFTDNVFLAETDGQSDGYVAFNPSVRAQSDWSRHALQLSAGGRFRRYFDATARNENGYFARGLGRADLGEVLSFTLEGQAGKIYESPFTSGTDAALAGISSYDYNQVGARAALTLNRDRFTLGYSRSEYDFNAIEIGAGTIIDQSDRDRVVHSIAGQVEHAISPDTAVFGQVSYTRTEYDRPLLSGESNRDSDGYRVLGGMNLDLSAFLRGSVGIGYTWRKYEAPIFPDVDGFSAEATIEYFPSQLTTLTFGARRVLEDSNFASIGAYFDNRASVRIDHELLRNLLLDASVSYAHQNYVASPRKNDVLQTKAGARYLISRMFEAGVDAVYSDRDRSGPDYEGQLDEFRVAASLILKY